MRNNITRWSPLTCGCVVELVSTYDDNNENPSPPRFLLMNEICDKHAHLASTVHKANHQQLSSNVLTLIEEAKAVNLGQVNSKLDEIHGRKWIRRRKKAKLERELNQCKALVNQFNESLNEEWQELVSFPDAFDEHIYEQILKEQNG